MSYQKFPPTLGPYRKLKRIYGFMNPHRFDFTSQNFPWEKLNPFLCFPLKMRRTRHPWRRNFPIHRWMIHLLAGNLTLSMAGRFWRSLPTQTLQFWSQHIFFPTNSVFSFLLFLSWAGFAPHVPKLALETELLIPCSFSLDASCNSGWTVPKSNFFVTSVKAELVFNLCFQGEKWCTWRIPLQLSWILG